MRKSLYNLILCVAFISSSVGLGYGADDSFLENSSTPFVQIKDSNEQARAWANCSATYKMLSELYSDSPAQSKQFEELGIGASVAVLIALIVEDLSPDISVDRFRSLWSYGLSASKEWPQSSYIAIKADAERNIQEQPKVFCSSEQYAWHLFKKP